MVPAFVVEESESPNIELLAKTFVFFGIEEFGQEDLLEFLFLKNLERTTLWQPRYDRTEVFTLLLLSINIGKKAKETGDEVFSFRGCLFWP